jgi:hypothetical protein
MDLTYIAGRVLRRRGCSKRSVAMPIESPYPAITVPQVDVWTHFLERPDREYPDDHGQFLLPQTCCEARRF